jgi:hypothetical protein
VSDDAAPGTGQDAELAGVFDQHRRHLRAIAYRMLGSLPDADDAVQETWVRFAAEHLHSRSDAPRPFCGSAGVGQLRAGDGAGFVVGYAEHTEQVDGKFVGCAVDG